MSDLVPDRTPPVIAAEINMIRYQAERAALHNAVEIGRRLKEAKDLLPHGEWGQWLQESVNYSHKTAAKMMRIYDAYGSREPAALEDGAQAAQELPDLSCTQALILLTVPEESRPQFLVEMDAEGMSTRELQKAVADWKQAQQEKDRALEERDQAWQEKESIRQVLDEEKNNSTKLTGERDKLKTEVASLTQAKQKLAQEIENKQASYDKLKERISYQNMEKMSNRLTAAYNKAEANRIAYLYESLDKTFKELAFEMTEFALKNAEVHAKYQEKVRDFLLKAIKEKL